MQEASQHIYSIGPAVQAVTMPPDNRYNMAAEDWKEHIPPAPTDFIVEPGFIADTRIDGTAIFDITKNNFAAIIDPDSKRRLKQVNSLNYIMFLASSMGVDISQWNVKEVFTNNDGTIYVDKGHVNQAFFAELDKLKSTAVYAGGETVPPDLAKALATISTRHGSGLVDKLSRSLASNYLHAESRYAVYIEKLKECARVNADLVRLRGEHGMNATVEIQKIIDSGRWRLLSSIEDARDKNMVILGTTSDIVCRHANQRAGVDITVNLGRAQARITFREMPFIEVLRHGGNLVLADGWWHPHISTAGTVCWGNVSAEIDQFFATWNLSKVFEILNSVLNDYNPLNPYIALETFHKYEADGGKRIDFHEQTRMSYCDEHEIDYPRDGECEMCAENDRDNGPDF